jgi:DNA-binding transcriptional LysR family regulator
MDLRQLSYFVAVAEEGQFTRAAERVSVAQPAVSAQIGRLERELGERLFHRDPRSVMLTPAGDALLPHARAALAAAERGRDTIASLRGMLTGRLRVGVAGPMDHRLAQVLGEFHQAHPAIEIALSHGQNEPMLDTLARGELDAALVGLGAQAQPPGVEAREVATEPLVVCVHREHPLREREAVALAELRDEPLLTLPQGSGLRTLVFNACRELGFLPRVVGETAELRSLVELAGVGLGVAIVPRSAAESDVAILRLTRPELWRRTALAWNRDGISPAGRAFISLAERRFGYG